MVLKVEKQFFVELHNKTNKTSILWSTESPPSNFKNQMSHKGLIAHIFKLLRLSFADFLRQIEFQA